VPFLLLSSRHAAKAFRGEDIGCSKGLRAFGAFILWVPANGNPDTEENHIMTVQDGKRVSIEYTLRLEDQSVVESNVGEEPLQFTQGAHEIIPGLEDALAGLTVGDTHQVTVAPEEAYGPIHPDGFQEVDKQQVPEDAWKVGAQLIARDEVGNERPLRVHEVRDNTIIVDLNHPLAGKTLIFDVKVLAVE
jgi:FKBP-type peptidyl-prolyl cis-trans isomerase SlyD